MQNQFYESSFVRDSFITTLAQTAPSFPPISVPKPLWGRKVAVTVEWRVVDDAEPLPGSNDFDTSGINRTGYPTADSLFGIASKRADAAIRATEDTAWEKAVLENWDRQEAERLRGRGTNQ